MAERQPPIFNPATISFIASGYGVDTPEELAPILGFPEGRLTAWAEGYDFPNWVELNRLCKTTGLSPESMVLRRTATTALAA